jgi:protein ImuB
MLWVGVHLPALSLESFIATLSGPSSGFVSEEALRAVAQEIVQRGHPPPSQASAPPTPAPASTPVPDDDADPVGPVALIEQHRLVAVNAAARELGLQPGQKRATALGLAPRTRLGEADPARDDAALLAIAHAMLAFTPAVSLAGGHVVLAEVQASLRYFGGLPRLLEQLRAALEPLGHEVRIACAPTAQAAQWFSMWRDDAQAGLQPARTKAELRERVGALPLALMAAAGPHLATLEALGLRTVSDLWKQPRAGLHRRFGAALLADIDRACGDLGDPRVSIVPAAVFESRLELFTRAEDSSALLTGAAVLLQRLTAWAAARHGRVAGFRLLLHHESRRRTWDDPAARTTIVEIGLGEPVSDTAHLQSLLRERLQRLPLSAPVLELGLHCDALVEGAPPNAELFPAAAGEGEGWQRLLERLEARLGEHHIRRLQTVADHRPERATKEQRGSLCAPAARAARQGPLRLPGSAETADTSSGDPSHWPRLRRPVWLLAEPQPLRETGGTPLLAGRPLWLVAGPERIEAGWWDEAFAARDYFIAQADDGALLWVFRFRHAPQADESGWYLHGRFG